MQRALNVTREQFADWYQAVVRDADMAESSPVRGCMVIKPWGYGVWERIQQLLDRRIKATGHENCYFPLFIPLAFIAREADHVEGFAKEMAVVTHHRLKRSTANCNPTPRPSWKSRWSSARPRRRSSATPSRAGSRAIATCRC